MKFQIERSYPEETPLLGASAQREGGFEGRANREMSDRGKTPTRATQRARTAYP